MPRSRLVLQPISMRTWVMTWIFLACQTVYESSEESSWTSIPKHGWHGWIRPHRRDIHQLPDFPRPDITRLATTDWPGLGHPEWMVSGVVVYVYVVCGLVNHLPLSLRRQPRAGPSRLRALSSAESGETNSSTRIICTTHCTTDIKGCQHKYKGWSSMVGHVYHRSIYWCKTNTIMLLIAQSVVLGSETLGRPSRRSNWL